MNMPDTPGKRPADGREIGVPEAEQKRRAEGEAPPIQRQEAAASACLLLRRGPEKRKAQVQPTRSLRRKSRERIGRAASESTERKARIHPSR